MVGDVRRAIPAHCFERSVVTSFRYLLVDLLAVAILFSLSRYIDSTFTDLQFGSIGGFVLRTAAWTLYWWLQGNVMTGLLVIGHECGHGGFSDYEWLNDSVGLVVHSLLLVPFFSWKISHRRHHSNTGNLDRDEVFVPPHQEQLGNNSSSSTSGNNGVTNGHSHHDEEGEEGRLVMSTLNSLYRSLYLTVRIVLMLTLGWPLYLLMNATGHRSYPSNRWVNHFAPSSPIFTTERERNQVRLSDLTLILVVSAFTWLSYHYGFLWFLKTYGVPYLITNLFLVLITFLQHTDPVLPHYSGAAWDWLRGALATIDRDYGYLNVMHHHIADTHVVHHLFFQMPHYHAEEATRAVVPLLGDYYRCDRTPIWRAVYSSFAKCNVVTPDQPKQQQAAPACPVHVQEGVYWFQRGQFQ